MKRVLDRLEKKLYRYSISNLMKYIVGITSIVFMVVFLTNNYSILNFMYFDPNLVMKGQIWRLVTFIFIPPSFSAISFFFMMMFYYFVGNSLENEWGTFRFNVYYLVGIIGSIIASFISNGLADITYLNLSLFLAFARLYPNYEVLLFFILPIKVKYLALIDWFIIIKAIIIYPLPFKLAALASIINFLLFFGKDMYSTGKSYKRKKSYVAKVTPIREYYHKCHVCGITEKDDPNMDFRYCSSCDGNYEYCMNHLKDHTHIKKS